MPVHAKIDVFVEITLCSSSTFTFSFKKLLSLYCATCGKASEH